ncbi:MAG: hypothetical protein ACI4JM_08430 [Oscillospiraceae bacterium]
MFADTSYQQKGGFQPPEFFCYVGANCVRPLRFTGNLIATVLRTAFAQPFFIKRLPKNLFGTIEGRGLRPHTPVEFRRLRTATSFFEKKLGKKLLVSLLFFIGSVCYYPTA